MADLRTSLRQAVTVDERCRAVDRMNLDLHIAGKVPLGSYTDNVQAVQLARRCQSGALLLGVVVGMVPDGWSLGFDVVATGVGPDRSIASLSGHDTVYERAARHPECAIALAVLDAMDARA